MYVVHFPAPYNSANSRIDALNNLYAIVNSHNDKWIALGDFNITSQEERDLGIYSQLNNDWYVSHLDGCKKCKGTFFYSQDGTWSFLDAIVFPKNKKMSLEVSYIFKNEINVDTKRFWNPYWEGYFRSSACCSRNKNQLTLIFSNFAFVFDSSSRSSNPYIDCSQWP